jgi:hypothetical protein
MRYIVTLLISGDGSDLTVDGNDDGADESLEVSVTAGRDAPLVEGIPGHTVATCFPTEAKNGVEITVGEPELLEPLSGLGRERQLSDLQPPHRLFSCSDHDLTQMQDRGSGD